jgi:hypothetical protein
MGAILLQKKSDGKKHPIAYYSKTLSAAECNYDVYDLELLALVSTLDHWHHYLAGSPHKIIIYSDHQNLLYWKNHIRSAGASQGKYSCSLSMTLKSVTLKESPTEEQTHYQDDPTMTKAKRTIKMLLYYQNRCSLGH